MRDGSIRNSVVVGTVACSDLRDCIILGSVTSREPHLSGAEILEPGGVARLPWEIGKD
jgi:hypothetical protein